MPDGGAYFSAGDFIVVHDAYKVTGDTITFQGESCANAAGTYHWTLVDGALTLTPVSDGCAARSAILTQQLDRLSRQLPWAGMQVAKVLAQADFEGRETIDATGNLFTTDGKSSFYKFAADGTPIASWGGLTYALGITVDSTGSIYVANFDPPSISKFDSSGKLLLSWQAEGGEIGPVDLAHDAHGNIYAVMHRVHKHYVEEFTSEGKLIAAFGDLGSGDGQILGGDHSGPESLAVDGLGNVYVADKLNNRIVKFDPNGKFVLNMTGDGQHKLLEPWIVTADSKGNAYAATYNTIWKFDPSGAFVGTWFIPYFVNIVVDSHDNLFAFDNKVIAVTLPMP